MGRPNKGPRLVLNRSGYYEVQWTEDGKTRQKSTGSRDKAEADFILRNWADGDVPAKTAKKRSAGSRISQILDRYWNDHACDVQSAATIACHINWMKQGLGFIEAKDLTTGDVSTYTRKRLKGLLGDRPVKSATVRRELGILKAALAHAIDHKVVKRDELPVIKLPPGGEPRDRYLSHEEIELLLRAAQAIRQEEEEPRLSRIERFLWIALFTGARRDAILGLEWDRVDLKRRMIDFRDPDLVVTKKRRVQVPISDQLLPILERAYEERTSGYVLDTDGPIRSVFDRACRKAGLDDVSPHVLRHTWASHASMRGVPLTDISRVLGNTLAICEKVYAKYQPGYLTHAVNAAYGGVNFDIEERVP